MKSTVSSLELIRFECLNEILCLRCHTPLDRHQPDYERPDQLLGTCFGCGSWYLIDGEVEVMFALPNLSDLRHE